MYLDETIDDHTDRDWEYLIANGYLSHTETDGLSLTDKGQKSITLSVAFSEGD